MKSRNLLVFTVCLLAILLIGSLGLNCYLYHQGRLYYLQLNLLSLDPAVVIVSTIFPIGEVPIERRPFWSDDVAEAIGEVNAYIRSLEGEGVVVFDAYSILADENGVTNSEYSQDLLHLSDAGYARLNNELVQVLTTIE